MRSKVGEVGDCMDDQFTRVVASDMAESISPSWCSLIGAMGSDEKFGNMLVLTLRGSVMTRSK